MLSLIALDALNVELNLKFISNLHQSEVNAFHGLGNDKRE